MSKPLNGHAPAVVGSLIVLAVGGMGIGLYSHGERLTAAETASTFVREDIGEIKADIADIKQKLDRLLHRQRERP